MKLREELEELTHEVKRVTLSYVLQALEKTVSDLKKVNFAQRALSVGEKAHDFSLTDLNGILISLDRLLLHGPVILIFYRGGWCPYCNLALRAWQKVIPEIHQLGAQVVAISPEKPENSQTTSHKNGLDYLMLTDRNNEIARKFGVSFVLPTYLKRLYRTFGLNLEKYNDTTTVQLPIPAIFLIDTNQMIQYVFADEDYTQWADTDEILSILAAQKEEECVYCY